MLCEYTQTNLEGVKLKVNSEKDAGKETEEQDLKNLFRRSIINMCQHKFNERIDKRKLIEEGKQNISDIIKTEKKKMLGNLKFIGDLFKQKLIHESIIHHILAKLLQNKSGDDDNSVQEWYNNLEACCQVLRTVGKAIDVKKAKDWIDQYFKYLKHYRPKVEPRIKFMIMDIIELRYNDWIPRRETDTVKKKEEIMKQFAQEQQERARPKRNQRDSRGDNRNNYSVHRNNMRTAVKGGRTGTTNAWGRSKGGSGSQDVRGGSGFNNRNQDSRAKSPTIISKSGFSNRSSGDRSSPVSSSNNKSESPKKKIANILEGKKRLDGEKTEKFVNFLSQDSDSKRLNAYFEHMFVDASEELRKQMLDVLHTMISNQKMSKSKLVQWAKDFFRRSPILYRKWTRRRHVYMQPLYWLKWWLRN
eukprot:UN24092